MESQIDYRQHLDPEYRRWSNRYPQFPGLAECLQLLKSNTLSDEWVDIIGGELAHHAKDCLPDLLTAFEAEIDPWIRLFLLMSLADARLKEAIPFLSQIVLSEKEPFVAYAQNALDALENSDSRTPYWKATRPPSC
jgi:hypothetical protein